jgi:hypothetical protein
MNHSLKKKIEEKIEEQEEEEAEGEIKPKTKTNDNLANSVADAPQTEGQTGELRIDLTQQIARRLGLELVLPVQRPLVHCSPGVSAFLQLIALS